MATNIKRAINLLRIIKLFHLRGGIHRSLIISGFLFFILCLFPQRINAEELPSCNFSTNPNPILETQIFEYSQTTFSFDGLEIAKAIDDQRLPYSGWLYFVFPDHDAILAGGCPWINALDKSGALFPGKKVTTISDITDVSINVAKGSIIPPTDLTPICSRGLLSTDHPSHAVEILYVYDSLGTTANKTLCRGTYSVQEPQSSCKVAWNLPPGSKGDTQSPFHFDVTDIQLHPKFNTIVAMINNVPVATETVIGSTTASFDVNNISPGGTTHTIKIFPASVNLSTVDLILDTKSCAEISFPVAETGKTNICTDPARNINPVTGEPTGLQCNGDYAECPGCPQDTAPKPQLPDLTPLCAQLPAEYLTACNTCKKDGKIYTAIGCVPTDFTSVINDYVFKYGIGIAGGIAFLRFLYGCFLILTSSGNSETVEESRAIIMSALAGLFLIIFSVFFLRTVGIDIFKIPGWRSETTSSPIGPPPNPCPDPSKPKDCGQGVCCAVAESCGPPLISTGKPSCVPPIPCPGTQDCDAVTETCKHITGGIYACVPKLP